MYWNKNPNEHGPLVEYKAAAGVFGGDKKYIVLAVIGAFLVFILFVVNLIFFRAKKIALAK